MKLEERLNEIIQEKESEIDDLKIELRRLEYKSDLDNFKHQLHEYFEESDLQKSLPVPRLEMRFKRLENHFSKDSWYNTCWHYGIVYKHFADVNNNSMLFIPLSLTLNNEGNGKFEDYYHNSKLSTPFRDIVHIFTESKVFNLPAYIICEEKNIVEPINLDSDFSESITKMIRK